MKLLRALLLGALLCAPPAHAASTWDTSGLLKVNAGLSLAAPVDTTAVAVSTSAVQLLTSLPAGTRIVLIQPVDGNVYIGASGVTTSTGIYLTSGQIFTVEWTAGTAWYGIASTGTTSVHILPVKGD